jgi:hypothetical protein
MIFPMLVELSVRDGVATTGGMMIGRGKEWAIPRDEDGIALFQASTEIKLRNGKKTIFWHDKWLNGAVPIDIALNLFKKAHFKKRTIARELWNKSWMCAVVTSPPDRSFWSLSNVRL